MGGGTDCGGPGENKSLGKQALRVFVCVYVWVYVCVCVCVC